MFPPKLRRWHTWQRALWLLAHEPRTFAWKTYRLLRPMRPAYRRRFRMRLGQWLVYHNQAIAFTHCSWMGVQTLKNPLDAWIYQEIFYEVRPDVVIEIGSYSGGSTLYLAHLLDLLDKGQVISIDIDRSHYHVQHPRIVTITGDSAARETVERVQALCCGKSVLVIHDGDHTREQVLNDLRSYAPLVSYNSYLIVEDGIIDLFKPGDSLGRYTEGPLVAIEQFLKEGPDFEVDHRNCGAEAPRLQAGEEAPLRP